MGMALGLVFATALAAFNGLQNPRTCSSYVGQTPAASSFAEVWNALPQIAPKGQFESTADYEGRLREAQVNSPGLLVVLGSRPDSGLSYNADRQELSIYRHAFGAGRVNFTNVFGLDRSRLDNFSGAIGFQLQNRPSAEGQQVSGAAAEHVPEIDAIWEKPGRLGQNQFIELPSYGPAKVRLSPANAQDLVERGRTAFLMTPRAPFRRTSDVDLVASLRSGVQRELIINVIVSDIECAFLLDGAGKVALAFTVR